MTKNNFISILVCLWVIELTTAVNSFFMDLKGGTIDAERFQADAIEWVLNGSIEFVTNAEFFVQFLGIIFWFFGESEFIASQFGIAASITACVYFIKINKELGIRTPDWAIYGFLLWPSYLLRQSTTMREPYLVLFVVLIAFFLILYKKYGRANDLLKLFIILILSILFHKATAVLFVFVSVYVVFFVMKQRGPMFRSRTFWLRLLIIGISVSGVLAVLLFFNNVRGLKPVIALLTADAEYIDRVLDYKTGRGFRTTYDVSLDVTSLPALVISLPKVFIYYMSYPFPWKVSTPLDVLAALEGIFRFGALVIIIKHSFRGVKIPAAAKPVFILGIVFCMIWAAGTSNYGTASRHHVTTNWIYLTAYLLYFAYVRNLRGVGIRRIILPRYAA
jgi:hypothetical protein